MAGADIENGYVLIGDDGKIKEVGEGALTPNDWECLDGTLYIDESGVPYLIFCHEHGQIVDGTICYAKLTESLDALEGDVVTMFCASSCDHVDPIGNEMFVI